MSAPIGVHCPGCGEHAAIVLPGQNQAFCGNDDCKILMWGTTQTLEEAMDSMGYVDLGGLFRDPP